MRDAIETAVPPGAEVTASSQPIERSAPSALLALQRGVGNQAVGRILAQLRSADRHAPTPAAIAPLLHHGLGGDRRAEARSGIAGAPVEHHAIPTAEGPRSVPVHDSDASHRAAARLGAWAYALDGSVALGAGVGCADGPTREEILRHELRHVSQMHQPGPPASSADLEREADAASGAPVILSAGRDDPLGVFWFVAIGVGLYIVFRPNVANAPGPGDATQPSVSGTQVAAEAVAIFAPGMFTVRLARMGLGVVGAFAATGAMSSVASRGVQDVGGGSFSGARAYVVDAATGAVIGVFVGGVFRLTPSGARMAQQARQRPDLTHFTTPAGASGIGASNEMCGGTGIWALEASAEAETPLLRAVRGTIPRSAAQVGVRVPGQAPSNFSQPFPVGPYSAYQNAMGVWRAPAGVINMTTGAFTPTGRVLPNLAGHFIPYGADLLVWVGAGAAASLAPQEQDPAEVRRRGLFGSLGIDPASAREMAISEPLEEVQPGDSRAGATPHAGAAGMDAGQAPETDASQIVILVDVSAGLDLSTFDGGVPLDIPGLPSRGADSGGAAAATEYDARAQRVGRDFGANPAGEARDRFANTFSTTYFPGHYDPTARQAVREALIRAHFDAARADEATTLLQ